MKNCICTIFILGWIKTRRSATAEILNSSVSTVWNQWAELESEDNFE